MWNNQETEMNISMGFAEMVMCLAIPGQVIEFIDEHRAIANFDGVVRKVGVDLVKDKIKVGDWVLVHAGFIIQIMDEESALASLEAIKQLANQ